MTTTKLRPVSGDALHQLFRAHAIDISHTAVNQAFDGLYGGTSTTTTAPIDQLTRVIRALDITGVQSAQVRWRRLDQRRLPALIYLGDDWQLIEKNADDQLLVDGKEVPNLTQDALADCPVLCIRNQRHSNQRSDAAEGKKASAASLVLKEVFRSRGWLRDVLIATVIINLLALATSLFAMQVYDRVVPTLAYATLWTLVAIMGLVVALDWLLKTLRSRILDSLASAVDQAVSQKVFDHILSLQLDTRPRSLGTLAAQVGGLDAVRQFFTSAIVFSLIDFPFAVMFIAFIGIIGGHIAWVYVILFPLAAALGWLTRLRLRRLLTEQLQRINERQGLLVETLQGTESIQSDDAGWRFSEKWRAISQSISRYNLLQKAISNRATITATSLATIAYVSALVVGVKQIELGFLTMGALIACSILGGRVIAPATQAVQYLVQWQNVVQSLQMVDDLLQMPAARRPDQVLLAPKLEHPSLTVDELTFAYPGTMIQQLNVARLHFNAGDRVVLLGPVGSGKSTLLKVMAGLYRPSSGRVRIGDTDLWELDPNWLAEQVSYLPQSVDLFKGTLYSNLCLTGNAGDSELSRISRELGIDRIAASSHLGMALPINEGGSGLSGGQKQLVGVARILLNQPRIWLLDEPTASLDPNTERQVLTTIQKHVGANDILVIATHKPVLARQLANRVIVMEQASIRDDGPTDDVLKRLLTPAANTVGGASPHVV